MSMKVERMIRTLSTGHLAMGQTLPRGTVTLCGDGENQKVVVVDDLKGERTDVPIVFGSFRTSTPIPGQFISKLPPADRDRWVERMFLVMWSHKPGVDTQAIGYRELPVTADTIVQVGAGAAVLPRAGIK